MIDLRLGDCLEVMKTIESGSVDAVITDPPYGTTACKWDSVIPFEPMWEQLNRITKPNGAIVLFGSEPFSSALRMSNIKNYKYDWIWEKNIPVNFVLANKRPMKYHENISVFYKKQPIYNKQMIERSESGKKRAGYKQSKRSKTSLTSFHLERNKELDINLKNPSDIIYFKKENKYQHPTQKPIALMEYLIKTYTNENETVLDFTMGSGTTMLACKNLNRNGIGVEMDTKYYAIAEARLQNNQ